MVLHPQGMQRYLWPWLLVALVVLLAGAAQAHRQGLREGYQLLAYDCSHDYGWESGHPEDLGHELVTLAVTEREEAGRALLIFELNFVQAMSVMGSKPSYEIRETLSFDGPRGSYTTTLRTTDEQTFTLVDGTAPAYIGPRKAGLTGVGEAYAEDASLIAVDVGYTYEQLRLQPGEHVRNFRVVGSYEQLGIWRQGDILPGGTTAPDGAHRPACRNGTTAPQDDASYFVLPSYSVERSDWSISAPVNRPPVAAFTFAPSIPTAGQSVSFTDASTDPDGNLAAWSWDFGDGSTSAARSPRHAYAAAGDYVVRLSVTDAAGLSASVERAVRVVRQADLNLPPVANLSWTPPNPLTGENVTFRDESSDADGAIAKRRWTFPDGSASADTSPVRSFARPGVYEITLAVTDSDNATTEIRRSFVVGNRPPAADLLVAPTPAHVGKPVAFRDRSVDPDGAIVDVAWHFDDGLRLAGAGVERTFSAPGTFSVRLVVTDEAGATSERAVTFVVDRSAVTPPAAAFRASRPTANVHEEVTFERLGTRDGETARWQFGDGSFAEGSVVKHAYARRGDYHVTLVVETPEGATNASTLRLSVLDRAPEGGFRAEPSAPRRAEPVRFVDEASDPEGGPLAWSWDFGDGGTSTEPAPTHAYSAAGAFTVVRRVVDEAGNAHETRLALRVQAPANEPPFVDFVLSDDKLRAGVNVTLTSRAFDPDGFVRRWEWLADGVAFAEGAQATFMPKRAGPVLLELRAWDDADASANATKRFVVVSLPLEARVVTTPADEPGKVVLQVETASELVAWEWHLPDGTTSRARTVVRDAAEAAAVRVVVTDREGRVAVATLGDATDEGAHLEASSIRETPIPLAAALGALALAAAWRRRG